MEKNKIALGIAVAVLVIGGLAWWKFGPAPLPDFNVPMTEGETVSSWNYRNAYTGNAELEAKAHAEIERLEKLFGSEEFTDYILYVSIANQYGLLGDGAQELAYLEKALAIDSEHTGLAWHNAGQLFARLGAYQTARYAFERMVAAQPIGQYRLAFAAFLEERYPGDPAIDELKGAAASSDGEIAY